MNTRFLLFVIACVTCTGMVLAQRVSAQVVSAQSVEDQLFEAAVERDLPHLEELLASHRLQAKPVAKRLVEQSALAAIGGDWPAARRARISAFVLAEQFARQYGEESLNNMVSPLPRWGRLQREEKLSADSLVDAAVSIRRASPDSAGGLFERALESYRSLGDRNGKAEVLGQLGYVSWFGDRESYIDRNLVALAARRAIDDRQLVGNTLNDLGLGYRAVARDLDTALTFYLEAEVLRREIGDSLALGRMLPNIGLTFEGLGQYERARDYYLDGGQFYLAAGDTARWITQRSNAAGILTDYAGRHSEALSLLLDLEQDMERVDDARTRAIVLMSIGIVNRRLGNYAGAVENYREVIQLSEDNGFDDLMGRVLNNIGVVYVFMARPDRALPFLERALQALPEDDAQGRSDVLLSLSSASFQLQDFEASQTYSEAVSSLGEVDQATRLKVKKMQADNKVRTGRAEEAIPDYQEMLELAEALALPGSATDAYFGLGEAEERLGRPEDALAHYELAAATLENARGLLRAEEDKAGYLAQTRYLYEDIVHFLTKEAASNPQGPFAARAFEFAERGKSRAFLDQMAEALAGVSQGVDPEFRSDLDVLAQNMDYLRNELAAANLASDREKAGELKDLVAQMEDEYQRVEREMRERNPRYAEIQYPEPITLTELQGLLGEGEVLLQYALGDSSSTLWAVTRDAYSLEQLPTRDQLEAQVELLRFNLENPAASAEAYSAPASRLYDWLVRPVANMVDEASRLVVVADGALHYVPFEALVRSDSGKDFGSLDYLIAQAPISYVQSASVLRTLRAEPPPEPTRELLAIGDPDFGGAEGVGFLRGSSLARLPFSGEEVETIAGLFLQGESAVLSDQEATKASVTEALQNDRYRFVHFATHGLVNDDRPDFSALALSGEGLDGLLQAREIFNLPVQAELVVLSACETGLGQLVKGEGMVGLTRAFMYAGAQSVLVSLWAVSDQSTSQLMTGLYESVARTDTDSATALRLAKLSMLTSRATSHPFHWAPFVLVGRGD